jgi:sulfur carrier protein ThiS adenylyltransferase
MRVDPTPAAIIATRHRAAAMQVIVNGQSTTVEAGSTVGSVRDRLKPTADILIVGGAVVEGGHALRSGDEITLIRRGEVPTADELEAFMAARHTPGVHARLKAATVGIAGLGGLGSAVAVALARIGVGRLVLADFDVVEPSNLNRQQYFVDQIGLAKTEALAANLRRINPHVAHDLHARRVEPGDVSGMFAGVQVMIEAFDRADQKLMLLESFTTAHPTVPFIAASGLAGTGDEASLRVQRLGPAIFVVGDQVSAAQPGRGLMAPRVGIVAHMQANLAVRLLLGEIE